ncbi:hypothetical protein [Marilutibacter alkalisoli]|uniref:Uncharacterized protein n=1 Tax=Marilutibacter alkalisoli TaxID=2591633 RepID=A0A514BTZ7_9GAMM|nr:hypothetical protein [Lysobacter alkalisoli]QDH70878.1 hypothetical protein FKV23_12875 [Lysobacter alkalisoli]
MEELKLLIGLVKDLPAMAIWVLVLFFAYKVCIIGSIYGVIRFCVDRLHNWLVTPKHELIKVDVEGHLRGVCITTDGSHEALYAQLDRIRGKGTRIDSKYIHGCSVEWLRKAIDAQEAADRVAATTEPRRAAA